MKLTYMESRNLDSYTYFYYQVKRDELPGYVYYRPSIFRTKFRHRLQVGL